MQRALVVIAMLALAACGPEQSAEPEAPETIGSQVYEVAATWCTGECLTYELYRDGEDLQLLGFHPSDHRFAGEVLATLMSDTETTLDLNLAAIAHGSQPIGSSDPGCLGFIDARRVTLTLDDQSFEYPGGCPPTGLAAIDAIYAELIASLPDCTSTNVAGCASTSF